MRSARFRPIYRQLIWLWVLVAVVLGVCGAHKPEGIWVVLSRIATLYYFFHFLVHPADPRQAGAPAAAAGEHQPAGAGRRRWAVARRRHRQADGEGMMRALRSLRLSPLASAGARPPRAGAGAGGHAAAAERSSGASTGLFGSLDLAAAQRGFQVYSEGLLQLPFDEAAALPRPGRHRPDAGADQGDRRRGHGAAGAGRPGPAEGGPGHAGRASSAPRSPTSRRRARRTTARCRRICR